MDRVDREHGNRHFATLFPGFCTIISNYCEGAPKAEEIRETWLPRLKALVENKLRDIEEQGDRKLEMLGEQRMFSNPELPAGSGKRWDENGNLVTAPVELVTDIDGLDFDDM